MIPSERTEKTVHANNNQKSRVAVLKLEDKKFVRKTNNDITSVKFQHSKKIQL